MINISVVFKAESRHGDPLRDLELENIQILENEKRCKPESLESISENKTINIGVVFDHSASMAKPDVEFLIEKILDEISCVVQTKSNSKLKKGDKIFLSQSKEGLILIEQKDGVWVVNFSKSVRRIIEEFGNVTLQKI